MQWRILLGLLSVLLGGCNSASPPVTASAPATIRPVRIPATPTAACAPALEAVQAYKGPGQHQTLRERVDADMAARPKAVPVGWRLMADQPAKGYCGVVYAADRDVNDRNADPILYAWEYTPATGQVTSEDPATKKVSGW